MTTITPPSRAPMNTARKATLAAGVLYLVTFISIPALLLIWPVLTDPNYIIAAWQRTPDRAAPPATPNRPCGRGGSRPGPPAGRPDRS